MAPEMLMNPMVAGLEMDGCGEMVFKCITVNHWLKIEMRYELTKIVLQEHSDFRRNFDAAGIPDPAEGRHHPTI